MQTTKQKTFSISIILCVSPIHQHSVDPKYLVLEWLDPNDFIKPYKSQYIIARFSNFFCAVKKELDPDLNSTNHVFEEA